MPLRVEFMRQRFEQDGVANVQLIMSSFAQMPFPESFFDLIVLNGVLEWLPRMNLRCVQAKYNWALFKNAFRFSGVEGIYISASKTDCIPAISLATKIHIVGYPL